MKYSLNAGEWNSVFAVPASVVDRYIKLASAGSLKLILFLMRHGGKEFTDEQLIEALGFRREGELEDAALFWIQRGLIRYDNTSLAAAAEEAPMQIKLPETEDIQPEKKAKSSVRAVTDSSAAIYTAADIADRINTDKAVAYLFKEAQNLYGRLIKQPESRTILMLVDQYELPAEVAVMLLRYCFKIGKTTPAYIQSVAQSWSDDGINSVEDADKRLAKLEQRFAAEEQLRKSMELKTKFSSKQLTFIKTWTEDWGFSVEMIMHAYDITLDNTGGMNFSYTNKILENWHADGITTKDAADELSRSRKGGKRPAVSDAMSSINVDDIMNDVMSKYQS